MSEQIDLDKLENSLEPIRKLSSAISPLAGALVEYALQHVDSLIAECRANRNTSQTMDKIIKEFYENDRPVRILGEAEKDSMSDLADRLKRLMIRGAYSRYQSNGVTVWLTTEENIHD